MTWLMTSSEVDRIEAILASTAPIGSEGTPPHKVFGMVMKKGGVAEIRIQGVLLPAPNFMLDVFGVEYTVYGDILAQIAQAIEGRANRTDFIMTSPGGDINGILPVMDAIAAMPMKTRVLASGMLASAAYMIASQANEIRAENELTMIGNMGLITERPVSPSTKSITNTDAPDKDPDVSTPEGEAAVRGVLDDIWGVLGPRVAKARGVSESDLREGYGKGAIMTARTALDKGMIDGIAEKQPAAVSMAAATKGDIRMITLEEFKAENPAGYKEAVAKGVAEERSRVEAHLIAADGGDVEAAHKAIVGGSAYDDKIKAQHDSFARKKFEIAARGQETPAPLTPKGEETPAPVAFKTEIEASCPGVEWEVM